MSMHRVDILALCWLLKSLFEMMLGLVFGGTFAAFGLLPLLVPSESASQNEAYVLSAVFIVIGLGVGLLVSVFAAPGLLIAWGLRRRADWARWMAMIMGALQVFHVPIGTMIGVYSVVVLWKGEGFEGARSL